MVLCRMKKGDWGMENTQILDTIFFDALSEASNTVFFWATDIQSNITRWSKGIVEYFDLPGEYSDDAVRDWLNMIHPDDVHSRL